MLVKKFVKKNICLFKKNWVKKLFGKKNLGQKISGQKNFLDQKPF